MSQKMGKKMNQDVIDAFAMFDIDKNGFVSAKELKKVFNQLGIIINNYKSNNNNNK